MHHLLGGESMFHLRHRIAGIVYPRYSRLVDLVNRNALVMKWYRDNVGVPQTEDRDSFYEFMMANYVKDEAIDYLEFGVHKGASMKKWTEISRHPRSRFFGFDSFEGLPEAWTPRLTRGAFDTQGAMPEIVDDRVTFVKGWFKDTLPKFLLSFSPRSRVVINNDSDLYSSTLYVLTILNCLLKRETIIIFDEFPSALHEFRAWNDYLSAYGRRATPIAITNDESARVAFIFD
jgi:O-methyltransferase